MYEQAWAVDRVQALVDGSQEGQKKSTSSSLSFQLIWWLSFRLIFTIETELGVFTTDTLSFLLLLLLSETSQFVSVFFCSFKISNYSDLFKDKHPWPGSDHKMSLKPKTASLLSRKPCLVLFLRGHPTLPAYTSFLVLHPVSGSSCIFPAPVLESTISLRRPGSLYWRTVLETKI